MILPGPLNLSLIRGIIFDSVVLLCRDEKVLVTSTTSAAQGEYVPSGTFGGYPLFILSGTPSWFCYFNAAAASYVIAQTLTTAALTNYFLPTSPPLTEPSGDYTGQGSLTGQTATAGDNPTDLTNFDVEANVRRSNKPDAEIVIDLNPSITDPTTGEITIPSISQADTAALQYIGTFAWDLVLTDTNNQRYGPFLSGSFVIADNITQPPVLPPA